MISEVVSPPSKPHAFFKNSLRLQIHSTFSLNEAQWGKGSRDHQDGLYIDFPVQITRLDLASLKRCGIELGDQNSKKKFPGRGTVPGHYSPFPGSWWASLFTPAASLRPFPFFGALKVPLA